MSEREKVRECGWVGERERARARGGVGRRESERAREERRESERLDNVFLCAL